VSHYRYIAFPRGRQPTKEEVEDLKRHDHVLAGRVAYGTKREDGRLAIAFDATVYDYALATERGFEALVRAWQSHGCEVLEHLAFVKDASALRPTTTNLPRFEHQPATTAGAPDKLMTAKELAAKEAIGRSRLQLQKTLGHFESLGRLAAAVPYLLMALAAIGTLVTGAYIGTKLTNTGRERRQQTIERAAEETLRRPKHEDAPATDGKTVETKR
jgi:hypothetical protein